MADDKYPIVGQRKLVCFQCKSPVRKGPKDSAGLEIGVVCMTENCSRFGLVSMIGIDPELKKQQEEEAGGAGHEGG